MSAPINDGGAAYPHFNPDTEITHPGMTLRDWFAGKVLASILATETQGEGLLFSKKGGEAESDYKLRNCLESYTWADAMLKAREAQP